MSYKKLFFHIKADGLTPETTDAKKIGEMLVELDAIIGDKKKYYFSCVEKGSSNLAFCIDENDYQDVKANIISNDKAVKHRDKLTNILKNLGTNVVADFEDNDRRNIINFYDIKKDIVKKQIVITESNIIDGKVIKVGGKDKTVPIVIEDESGNTINCNTTREKAKSIASHLFETLRFSGEGTWRKNENVWVLEKFNIDEFEILKDLSIKDTIKELQNIDGNKWVHEKNCVELCEKIRGDKNE